MNKRLPYIAPTAKTIWISSVDVITVSAVDEDGSLSQISFGDFYYFE